MFCKKLLAWPSNLRLVCCRNCSISYNELDTFESKILFFHNDVRSKHEDTPPLCWSRKLALDAQIWADKLAADPDSAVKASEYVYGENIHRGSIMGPLSDLTSDKIAERSTGAWYEEEHDYTYAFDSAGFSDKTKYFTQMVWASTLEVGCGFNSTGNDRYFFVVCEYTPSGNEGSKSSYHDNVHRKIMCEAPSVPHGRATKRAPFYLRSNVDLVCDPGYTLQGSSSGECTADKTWLFAQSPRCTGCVVPHISYGLSDKGSGVIVNDGELVEYSCVQGYHLEGMRIVQCSGNTLSLPLPRCRQEEHCLRPIIENGVAYTRREYEQYSVNDVWNHNIPEGQSVTISCTVGYDLVGNRTPTCSRESFGSVAKCKPCYTLDKASMQYVNVFSGERSLEPPLCFDPGAEAVSGTLSHSSIRVVLVVGFLLLQMPTS